MGCFGCWLYACAGTPKTAVTSCRLPAAQAQPAAQLAAAGAQLSPAELVGAWTQYWAPCGRADTQRYVFLPDGRFGWRAPQGTASLQGPLQQSGRYNVQDGTLVLQVERERFAACSSGCANRTQPRIVEHAPALSLSVELGACPQNAEAEHVDAAYRCFGLAGHAFWRHELPSAADTQPFFE